MHKHPKFRLSPAALAVAAVMSQAWAHAGDAMPNSSANGGTLSYVDARSSVGVGVNDEGDISGELRHVLNADSLSALVGEAWLQQDAGGVKLTYNWIPGDPEGRPDRARTVRRAFAAWDRNGDFSKISLGGGVEDARGHVLGYVSHGLGDTRTLSQTSESSTSSVNGFDNGRPYVDTTVTTLTTERLERAFDWGVGARAGRFVEEINLGLNLGFDHEWGKNDASQTTLSFEAEKFIQNTPWSVSFRGELIKRDATGNDDEEGRAWIILRHAFGRSPRTPSTYPVARGERPALSAAPATSTSPTQATGSAAAIASSKTVSGAQTQVASTAGQADDRTAVTSAGTGSQGAPTKTEKRLIKTTASFQTDTYFLFDSSRLTPKATALLEGLAKELNTQGYVENIKLSGHTCDIGTREYNQDLSQRRATSVKGFLVGKGGLPSDRIVAQGFGEDAPRFPNNRAERHKNRRVDIEYLSYVSKEELVQVPAGREAPTVTAAAAAGPADMTKPAGAAGQPATPDGKAIASPARDMSAQAAQAAAPEGILLTREEVEFEPAWLQRALLNSVPHKRTVDTYIYTATRTGTSTTREYINRGPGAVDDSYTADSPAPMLLSVLTNDFDPDGDTLTITQVSAPARGSVSISGSQLLYTPPTTGARQETFTYTINDGRGGVATGRVTVNLGLLNAAPLARDDTFVVPGTAQSTLDVLANDLDPDGDALSILGFTQPSTGTLTLTGGVLLFNPYERFLSDTFSYTVSDGRGGESTALVTLIDP